MQTDLRYVHADALRLWAFVITGKNRVITDATWRWMRLPAADSLLAPATALAVRRRVGQMDRRGHRADAADIARSQGMPLARINNRLIYFAHIPKTGGSSIEAYMAQKGKVALLQSSNLNWSKCTAQHAESRIYTDLFRDGFYDYGFTVVRDPQDRLMSEYRMRLAAPSAHSPRPRRTLRSIGQALLAPWARTPEKFPDFDHWVEIVFARYAQQPYLHDNHLRPQAEFVHPEHRVFLFEHGLEPVFCWIDEVTGTPPGDRQVHKRRAASTPVVCSPATGGMIRDFYREDYALIDRLRLERA